MKIGGIGIVGITFIVLLTGKCWGGLDIAWFWVFFPVTLPATIVACLLAVVLVAAIGADIHDRLT